MTNWNLEGLYVAGKYMGEYPVSGRVTMSRVKYGGGVQHTVVLDSPLFLFETKRDRVLLDHENITKVMSNA